MVSIGVGCPISEPPTASDCAFQLIISNNARIAGQFADSTGPLVGLYADLANEIRYLACKALTDHCGLIGHQNALNISIGRGGLLQDAQKSTNSGSSRVWPQPAGRNRCGKILMTGPPFHRYCSSRLLRGRTIRAFALTKSQKEKDAATNTCLGSGPKLLNNLMRRFMFAVCGLRCMRGVLCETLFFPRLL
jgi:hypothetical protein